MLYDYALVYLPDGTEVRVDLAYLSIDFQSYDRYTLYGTDGTGYLVGRENCILVNDPDIDTNVGTLSGTFKLNIKPTEAIIRKPNGEIIEVACGEDNNILTDLVDESGKRYTTDSNNCWIKFTYNQ